jgi:hypothetical protein
MALTILPLELNNPSLKVPKIRFKSLISSGEGNDVTDEEFYFPCPPSLQWSDSGSFGTIDINVGQKVTDSLKSIPGIGGATDLGMAKVRQTANPNTSTTFSGNAMRTFQFSFTFLPKSQGEAIAINRSLRYFQECAYGSTSNSPLLKFQDFVKDPEELSDEDKKRAAGLMGKIIKKGSEQFLAYPPQWEISFVLDDNLTENPYVPGIGKCYLTSVQTILNQNSSSFYSDGSPTSVELQLSFQETEIQTREKIAGINSNVPRPNQASDIIKQVNSVFSGGDLGGLLNSASSKLSGGITNLVNKVLK